MPTRRMSAVLCGGLIWLLSGCVDGGGQAPGLGAPTASTAPESTRRGEAGAPDRQDQPIITSPDRTLSFRPEDLNPVRFGVAVGGSNPERLGELETLAGERVGIVRVFARWDTPFPTATHQRLLNDGRVIHLSVRPRTDAGEVITWRELAEAEPGSSVHLRMEEWAQLVAGFGSQVYFTLNHEPETRDSAANGEAQDFAAAWRRMEEVMRLNGGEDVKLVLVLGRGAYASGEIDEWYPGDDVVDVVGADPYNWYRCQGTDRPWESPSELIDAPLRFAIDHGKPLALPEIASTEDPNDPDRKAAWIIELAETLGSPGVAEHLEFVAWFSVHDRSWPGCQWEYDSSPAAAAALADTILWLNTEPD